MPKTGKEVLREVDDEARALARELLRSTPTGSLATIDPADQSPFSSLVTVATDIDGSPLILISELSTHTQALHRDARCSLLLARPGRGDPLAHPRITLTAKAHFLERTGVAQERAARRFLQRHEKATLYAGFADFSFVRLELLRASMNAGFGKAFEMQPADLLSEASRLSGFNDTEPSAIEHMNTDHGDAVDLYATRLCRQPAGSWRLTGIDPHGMDLSCDEHTTRYAFTPPLTNAGDIHGRLVELAGIAREAQPGEPQ